MTISIKNLLTNAFLGGLAISLGVIISNIVNHPLLSPLMFAVGIMLCIGLKLLLVTAVTPSYTSSYDRKDSIFYRTIRTEEVAVVIGVTYFMNILASGIMGALFGSMMINVPDYYISATTFVRAILTGIIIGCVAISNKYPNRYTILITVILMWAFVYMGLPHCVVVAYWCGANIVGTAHSTDIEMAMICVTMGNIIGGLIIRGLYFLKMWASDKE